MKILDKMNDFFLNGYPNENFKLKDDTIAYLITFHYDEETPSSLKEIGNKAFYGTATNEEYYEMSSHLVPKIVTNVFNSLTLKSDVFYLEYQEDIDEEKCFHRISKNQIINQKSLGKILTDCNYFSDIGFTLYGKKEDWGYFFGEDLYAKYPGDIIEFKHFHLFTVKKKIQKKFLDIIKKVIKNEVVIKKMKSVNAITIDNENVYEISF
ncbi:hypothetical protein [Tenacibaculum maritimum]|uniref:hypothetical protein n=1 Tax=Tenacibaculum maritimum TaxID=107401 RepID=UPI0012E56AC5|nr:hypothetical protein [Tenacibaculum maritimum]CAA0210455.1 hypothetical protein FS0810_260005 [Tenacibaculum maritimum]